MPLLEQLELEKLKSSKKANFVLIPQRSRLDHCLLNRAPRKVIG